MVLAFQYTVWCTQFSKEYGAHSLIHSLVHTVQYTIWCTQFSKQYDAHSLIHCMVHNYKYTHIISNCIIYIPILNINRMKQHSLYRSNITGIFVRCTYNLITWTYFHRHWLAYKLLILSPALVEWALQTCLAGWHTWTHIQLVAAPNLHNIA